jgi:MFS family permease
MLYVIDVRSFCSKESIMKAIIKNVACVLVACLTPSVVECAVFATPSWMHTVSRNLEGRSLTAKSAEEFKKKQLVAAAAEKKVVPLAATGTAIPAILTAVFANMAKYDSRRGRNREMGWGLGLTGLSASATAGYAANIPGAVKRKKMHELHAKHADLLYALLQDPEFKKKMGVKNWETVRRRRKKAEAVGLTVQTVGSILGIILPFFVARWSDKNGYQAANDVAISGIFTLPVLIGLGAKPLITRLMRKKGGVERLNKEFAKAIAAAEAREKEQQAATVA